MPRVFAPIAGLFSVAVLTSCGGGGGATPTGPAVVAASSMAIASGDGQTARRGSAIASPAVVTVLSATGAPVAGVTVTFAVTAGGGTPTAATAVTDAAGHASTGWTLGAAIGANTLKATANGGTNPTVSFAATARYPLWTVMVYLAADNSLAIAGVNDLDEMDAAGANPEVQVVVEGEYSQSQFAEAGCTASCANLANFNTFRYNVTGTGNTRVGPDHAVTDIGNVDMTAPATLSSFLTYAKTSFPAERYLLVLWNHGGGFTGLISDETSASGRVMTLDEMRTGLNGFGGQIDVIDFDMCLMGGVETLEKVSGVAKYAVFSELTVPGQGNPYTALLASLQANASAATRTIAGNWVDGFNTSFVGARSSTTKSAYDLSAYAAFDGALTSFATTLSSNVATFRPAVQAASLASQKFDYPFLTDLTNFLDSLTPRVVDATLLTQIAALKAQVTGSGFRIVSRARNGSDASAPNVSRANGIHLLIPSGGTTDRLPSTGPGSFTSYQALFPSKAWTTFLAAYLSTSTSNAFVNVGTFRPEDFVVWDTASVSKSVDVDLWVVEPDGKLYIPWLGSVTANGALSDDSEKNHYWFESYRLNQYVMLGRYKFYAYLYADPTNHKPLVDVQYRNTPGVALTSVYSPSYPQLSLVTKAFSDPAVTLAKIEAGNYTDVKYLAFFDITSPPFLTGTTPGSLVAPASVAVGSQPMSSVATGDGPGITPAQLATVKRALELRRRTGISRAATTAWPGRPAVAAPERK